jgi:hypothetical protein
MDAFERGALKRIQFAHDCAAPAKREPNGQAWQVSAETIATDGYNLDRMNPNRDPESEQVPTGVLLSRILDKESEINALLEQLNSDLLTTIVYETLRSSQFTRPESTTSSASLSGPTRLTRSSSVSASPE